MSYDDWMEVVKKIASDPKAKIYSPECPGELISYRYIGNLETRVGYLIAWCNVSKKGIHISRVKAPDGIDLISMDLPIEEVNAGIPKDIEFVSPEVNELGM